MTMFWPETHSTSLGALIHFGATERLGLANSMISEEGRTSIWPSALARLSLKSGLNQLNSISYCRATIGRSEMDASARGEHLETIPVRSLVANTRSTREGFQFAASWNKLSSSEAAQLTIDQHFSRVIDACSFICGPKGGFGVRVAKLEWPRQEEAKAKAEAKRGRQYKIRVLVCGSGH